MMTTSGRRWWLRAATALMSFTVLPGTFLFVGTSGTAYADVCAGAGRRISVGGCVDVAGAVAPYVPPPAYYAPLPEDVPPPPPPPGSNVSGCLGYNGRWVHAGGCN